MNGLNKGFLRKVIKMMCQTPVSKLTVKVKRLTQEIAMFEEEMKKKLQAKEDCK